MNENNFKIVIKGDASTGDMKSHIKGPSGDVVKAMTVTLAHTIAHTSDSKESAMRAALEIGSILIDFTAKSFKEGKSDE